MTDPGFDRRFTAWLDERAQPTAPDGLLADTLAHTAQTRPRPTWRIIERWIPMPTPIRLALIPRATIVLVILTLLAAFGAAALVVGAQPSPGPRLADASPSPSPRVPPPTGPARNGLIAFDSAGDIWEANPDGTDPHPMTSGPSVDIDPTFSPDGTLIAYWSLIEPDPSATLDEARISALIGTSTASLVVAHADGGEPAILVEGVTLDTYALTPSWAGDSRRLAYGHFDGPAQVIDIVGVDGSAPIRLVAGETPAWSPIDDRIAYKGQGGVMVVDGKGTDPLQVSRQPGAGMAFSMPQWSPEGDRLAYYTDGPRGGHDIWVVGADGSNEHVVSDVPADEFWPYWSPDGTRIAFTGNDRAGDLGGLVVVDADGSDRVVMGVGSVGGGAPTVWSPDGTMLLGFHSQPSDGYEPGVLLLDASGAEPSVRAPIPVKSLWNTGSWQRLAE